MATVVGEAGGSALREALLRTLALPGALLFGAVISLPSIVWTLSGSENPMALVAIGAVTLSLGGWLIRRNLIDGYDMFIEGRDWAKGAAGERSTAADLRLLPDEYLVLNDVHPGFRGPNASWNWDHVIVGPNGLFVVDSKNYTASRIADGQSDSRTRRNVRQVRNYALAFKSELVRLNPDLRSVFVVPVLAYVNESTWVERLREGDVRVLPMRLLRHDILTGPSSHLSAAEAIKIANLLFRMYETHQQAAYQSEYAAWGARVRATEWATSGGGVTTGSNATVEVEDTAPALSCPKCGSAMALRNGQFGAFYGCVTYRATGCRGKRDVDGRIK